LELQNDLAHSQAQTLMKATKGIFGVYALKVSIINIVHTHNEYKAIHGELAQIASN
jgi:hypothetical protein